MAYIKLEDLQKFPIRKDHYDKEHGSEHFVFGVESVLEYAEYLPQYTFEGAEEKLAKLAQTAISTLEGMKTQLYGEEERPNDLVDCGCIDGAYNAWIDVLNFLGVKHSFEPQPM